MTDSQNTVATHDDSAQRRADRQHWYQAAQRQRDRWSTAETRRSWSRLLLALGVILPWIVLLKLPLLAAVISAACIAGFIWMIGRHERAVAQREFCDKHLLVLEEAATRLGGQVCVIRSAARPADSETPVELPNVFNTGPTWPLTRQEIDDLDLYDSPVGLFGILNRTSTSIGARRLRYALEHPLIDRDRILARQAMTRWLADNPLARTRLMAGLALMRSEQHRVTRFLAAVANAKTVDTLLPIDLIRVLSTFSGLLTLLLGVLLIAGYWGAFGGILLLFLANGALLRRWRARNGEPLEPWQDVAWGARAALHAARVAADELPASFDLDALRRDCRQLADRDNLPRLLRRLGWSERGGLGYQLANYATHADIHLAVSIVNHAAEHRDTILRGLSALAELDMLSSLGAFAWEQPVTCYPEFQDTLGLALTDGVHPLIPPDRVVPNSIELDQQTRMWIITGSNMAGKSTFLRMVAINVLLAQVGGAATARNMRLTPLRLLTDLRARDNLSENESYFMAEVRQLRRMVIPPEGAPPILGLIDEPFRGTNAHDQSAASRAVATHLLQQGHLYLIATHDQLLTALADGNHARNYHFREDLDAQMLVFDYRLHEGPAGQRNALRILQAEGYPQAVVDAAHNCESRTPPKQP